ncbi:MULTISPECIES: PL29 family lyase N-terminal domain-containing protein [Phocaeicola]|uniref:Uncharacterized protein n=1 Tax=Phocaeicola vulgatus TaxID=821 RepID=A0A415BVI8_PHOVU|nr:PL29 family lyase N-terminal domain-containing protein [Phocaeicola vulgatus]RHI96175.1 hypothetical protein DW150_02335 [Phocaeicola vulgatus]
MNKKFLSAILFGALMVSSTGTFVSCKDYDDDIDNINKELSTLKGDLSALQAKVNEGKWITSLAPTTGGFTVTFSDNTSYTITNGKDGAAGADAVKWEIGTDGFWYKNDVKTEYQAVGQAGEAGVAGVSPYIGENGNWFAYNTETKEVEDTGISAAGTSTYVVKNGDNYELHVYNQTTGEYESIVLPATAAAAALNVVFMPTYSDMQTRVVAINIPVGDELNDKNHLWDNNVSLTNDIVFNYRVSPASIDLAKANIGFLVNEVQSRAAGSILDVADKSFADGVLTVKAKAGEAFSLKNKKYAVALQVQNDAQTALSTYHLLTSQTIDRRNLTVFEARKDDNGDESYMNWSTPIPMNLLYTGELNVADTLSVGDYTSYNSYKDLRKYGFAPYYEVAKKAGEDKGNYFTVENGVIKTNGQISSVGHNCTFIVSVYDKKDGYKLAEKELTVSSVEKIATTKTYTKSETHELTLESKDYRFKFDMNDVYNTLGMSSQTFWSAGYTREYYIWDADRSEYVPTSNGVISAGSVYENNENILYVDVENILTKEQLGKYKVVFKIGNTGAEVVYEVKVVYPEVTLIKDNDYWKDGYMINAGKLVGSNYVMSGDLRRGYKNEDVDLVFEKVAGETRTDFDLINDVLTYTGDCNDKEGNRINISTIDPVDVMVFVLINGQKIDNGTKIQVKFADPLKNITLKKDAKFETTDKKSPADKLQLNSAINLVSIAGEKVIENGTMDATIAGYYNAQAAKFEVSEEDAAKGASVNATTGEFRWQNDGVALTANKTINVKVTVTYTWGVAVGTIPVTVKSNL